MASNTRVDAARITNRRMGAAELGGARGPWCGALEYNLRFHRDSGNGIGHRARCAVLQSPGVADPALAWVQFQPKVRVYSEVPIGYRSLPKRNGLRSVG